MLKTFSESPATSEWQWTYACERSWLPNESRSAIHHETLSVFTALNEFWRITVRKMELALSCVFWCTRIVVFAVVAISTAWGRLCWWLDSWNTYLMDNYKCWQPHPKRVQQDNLSRNIVRIHCTERILMDHCEENGTCLELRFLVYTDCCLRSCSHFHRLREVVLEAGQLEHLLMDNYKCWRPHPKRVQQGKSFTKHCPWIHCTERISKDHCEENGTCFELRFLVYTDCCLRSCSHFHRLREVVLVVGQLEHLLMDNYKCWQPHPKRVQQGNLSRNIVRIHYTERILKDHCEENENCLELRFLVYTDCCLRSCSHSHRLREVVLVVGQLEHLLMDNYKCWQPHPKRVQQGNLSRNIVRVHCTERILKDHCEENRTCLELRFLVYTDCCLRSCSHFHRLREVVLVAGQLEHLLMDNYKCWQSHLKRVQQGNPSRNIVRIHYTERILKDHCEENGTCLELRFLVYTDCCLRSCSHFHRLREVVLVAGQLEHLPDG